MNMTIRPLNQNDFTYYQIMDTGISFDYIIYEFNDLITGDNRIYGLFYDNQLVSIAGFSLYANRYAMLGRLRTDRRYRGGGLSTRVLSHVLKKVSEINGIKWVGANTQRNNSSARRVLEKLDLTPYTTLFNAITQDPAEFETGGALWRPITDIDQKQKWLDTIYIQPQAIFPYECYNPLPASIDLFNEKELDSWSFYENPDQTRCLITKHDQKHYHYLHAVYPWNDFLSQPGLWETIDRDYKNLAQQWDRETYVWIDLRQDQANMLPSNHSFELASPWILYGQEI